MDWQSAELHCMQHFGTHLVSIHSNAEYQQITQQIASRGLASYNFYIGLSSLGNGTFIDDYIWSDATQFEFGSNVESGTYPWYESANAPNQFREQYVALWAEYDLLWNVVDGDLKLYWICGDGSIPSSTSFLSQPESLNVHETTMPLTSVVILMVILILCVCISACLFIIFINKHELSAKHMQLPPSKADNVNKAISLNIQCNASDTNTNRNMPHKNPKIQEQKVGTVSSEIHLQSASNLLSVCSPDDRGSDTEITVNSAVSVISPPSAGPSSFRYPRQSLASTATFPVTPKEMADLVMEQLDEMHEEEESAEEMYDPSKSKQHLRCSTLGTQVIEAMEQANREGRCFSDEGLSDTDIQRWMNSQQQQGEVVQITIKSAN